jgi:tripartite-type tricarboxylate transporter receptor subunit TctC
MFNINKGPLVLFLLGISLVMGLVPNNSLSQEPYPTRPITMVIRSGAGGMADTMTRLLCKAGEKELGQPIICENRTGAGGVVGMSYVLKSKSDGYILGASTTGPYINNPHMEKVPYDPLTDVTDIMVYFKYTHGLCVRSDAPWNTFEDVLAFAKQNPGKFTYGAAGVGVTQHIVMERIAMKEGIKLSFVPFKSGAEPTLACLGGHIHAVAQGPADVVPHIQAGKLKLLFALNDERWPIAPNVPTVLEKYGFFGLSLQGIYGPKGIPEPIREKLQEAFKKAMSDPSYVEGAKTLNVVAFYMNGKDYEKLWKSQYEEMGKIIRAIGLGKK